MNNPLGVSPSKGNQETTRGKEKSFDLGGNRTHDLQNRVWTIIQQVIKKQSLNAYHSLGLCDNLYIIIELIKQIKLDVEGGFRWKYGGRASLPVCGILRRGIDVYSSFSPRSGEGEFCATISSTCTTCSRAMYSMFLHEHLWKPQSDLQLHLKISNAWASGGSVLMGRVFHLLVSNPNLVAGVQHLSTAVPGGKPRGCGRHRLRK